MTLGHVFYGLLAVLPGAMMNSPCLETPLERLPEPSCTINNLTIVSTTIPRKEIACSTSTPQSLFATQPEVYLANFDRSRSQQSNFILLAHDITANKLLWGLSNIKPGDENIVSKINANTTILKPYEAISVDPRNKQHVLEFAVFERQPDNTSAVEATVDRSAVTSPFNLQQWISRQTESGVELGGPSAISRITVHADAPPNSAATPPTADGARETVTTRQSATVFRAARHRVPSSGSQPGRTFQLPALTSMFNSFYADDVDAPQNAPAAQAKAPADLATKPTTSADKQSEPPKQLQSPDNETVSLKPSQSAAGKIDPSQLEKANAKTAAPPKQQNATTVQPSVATKDATESPASPGKKEAAKPTRSSDAKLTESTKVAAPAANITQSTKPPATTSDKQETTTTAAPAAIYEVPHNPKLDNRQNEQPTKEQRETTTRKQRQPTKKSETTTTDSSTPDHKSNFGVNFKSDTALIIVLVVFSNLGIRFVH